MTGPRRLGILLSGRGSNFLAIAEAIQPGPPAQRGNRRRHLQPPRRAGNRCRHRARIPAQVIEAQGRPRAEHDAEIVAALQAQSVELVCLAGYMRLLSPQFVRAFPQRILNIHPSLLPAFPGLDAQRQAIDYGVAVAGCTVHFVDEELDHGVIVLQKAVPVLPGDDEHSLAERILAQEHIAYAEAIARVLSGNYQIVGRRFIPKPSAPRPA